MRKTIIALLLAAATPAWAAPADDLARVLDDHWAWYLKNNPLSATFYGERGGESELGDFTLAAQDRQAKEAAELIARLDAIPDSGLSPAQRVDKAIVKRGLAEQIEANRFGQRTMIFSSTGSFHQFLPELGNFMPLRSKADYENYIARLEKVPAAVDQAIAVSREGVKGGFTQPCVTLGGFGATITAEIADDATKSRFYGPFTRRKPDSISDADWEALQARGARAITQGVNPAYRNFSTFFEKEYLPKCRKDIATTAMPNGKAYYAFRVRQETTTDLSPDRIHQIGLDEVKRIRGEMDALAKKAGFASREAFIQELRTNPKYYAKTPEELLTYTARQTKIIDGKMPEIMGRLPRLPYGIKEIPAANAETQTTAYYYPGSPAAGLAGFYFVNTSKLDQRPFWEVPVLTVHEAVPGHHHQIALQQELEISPYRRNAANFTAFSEGWGLYSERLGIEMGLYDTPEKEMGRLSYDMWRACRLVVDTGMHAKGWSRDKAVAFMKDNSAMSDANIDAEVNRYIGWPGQALAYKIGQLKIMELRQKAEKALGERFDLRHFHDAVLDQGAVPLDVLETQVDTWIAAEKAKA
ncbi:DUF885 domain-containing protein [Allosphingosinicella indica]|uniref:Uncharacterized conserved protein, DUF885 familyt n=1 Tax=Allosphingosinicella indica TaxID=941907 RepID=A0A1X7FZL4_9SPHN|nr:DUF885 domain-containing protein [Allosphingosinicella indica]SMF61558.1 Uncharacterized conserved protein, DUF885 familyt [Allosphingosinicella indica]